MNEEDTKLIMFGWIVTLLPELIPQIFNDKEKLDKVNELVDKLYDLLVS